MTPWVHLVYLSSTSMLGPTCVNPLNQWASHDTSFRDLCDAYLSYCKDWTHRSRPRELSVCDTVVWYSPIPNRRRAFVESNPGVHSQVYRRYARESRCPVVHDTGDTIHRQYKCHHYQRHSLPRVNALGSIVSPRCSRQSLLICWKNKSDHSIFVESQYPF